LDTDKQRFGLKTFTNADNRDIISDFLTHLHTHRVDFNTSLRHLSTLRPSSSPETIESFTRKMLSASIPNPSDEKINDASKDFIPYLERYCARISQPEEISAWEVAQVEKEKKGLKLDGEGWEEKREVEMLRSNPAFVLRQWVLEELISKLEETGVEGIEEGRRELARVLDVRLFLFLLSLSSLSLCSFSFFYVITSPYRFPILDNWNVLGEVLISDVNSPIHQLVRSRTPRKASMRFRCKRHVGFPMFLFLLAPFYLPTCGKMSSSEMRLDEVFVVTISIHVHIDMKYITCHYMLCTDADYKTLRFEAGDLDLSLSLLLSSLVVSYRYDGDLGTYSCFLLLSLSPLLSRSLRSLSPRSERSLSLLSPRSRSSYLLLLLLFISSCPTQQLAPRRFLKMTA
jgi:hypothetical protein